MTEIEVAWPARNGWIDSLVDMLALHREHGENAAGPLRKPAENSRFED